MRYHKAQLRHELKYFISQGEYAALRGRLQPFLALDKHTVDPLGYHIRSLYFDDMYDTAMVEKLSGQQRRNKYRVRIYGLSDAMITMERKSKFDAYISKTAARLTRAQFEAMLAGDYAPLLRTGDPLLIEVFARRRAVLLRPAVVVDYLREAYVYAPGNVRLTFDKNIRAGFGGYDIFSADMPTSPVLESGQMVMEVKYDDFLPALVRDLLRPVTGELCAASKYVLCRERLADHKTVSRRVVRTIDG